VGSPLGFAEDCTPMALIQSGNDMHTLTSASSLLLMSTLENHGNRLSGPHRAALYNLCSTLTDFATGALSGRKVFALSTGLGKTSAIIAWLTILARMGGEAEHVSVAVSASKVEALCSIKRALLAGGVPEELIGLKHSLSDASLPSVTGDDDRRFMLVTHQRVRGGGNHRLFCEHKGRPRNLLIYDESLFRSDAIAIGARDVRGGLGFLSAVVSNKPEVTGVVDYLARCRDLIADAVKQATVADPAGKALEVTLPELSELERAGYPALLNGIARKPAERGMAEPLLELIALSGCAMRVAVTPQGEGLLWHRIAIPDTLDNVLVLDASYPIRQLCKLDPTLTPASRFSDAPIKRWDNVRVHQMYAAGGRSSVAASFLQERRENRAVSREVVEVVKRIPPDEAVLVFVFKDSNGRIAQNLRYDIREAGINTEAKLPDGRDRFNVLAWGSETSLNDFAHCRHVILAGVLHRSLLDLASVAVGQLDNREAKLDGKWLLELMRSEVSHCAFQAISRGSCREVNMGQAKPMDAYVILPWALEPHLQPVMPGAAFDAWLPVHGEVNNSEATRMALAVLEHLKGLPESVLRVPTKNIREALSIPTAQKMAFSRAMKQLTDMSQWQRQGHSLVRGAEAFGFTSEVT
jgi:hypothetical protein